MPNAAEPTAPESATAEATKTYVVTGGASGIGKATTELLRSQGHRVLVVDRVDADVVADLSTPAGRQSAIAAVKSAAGVLHGIVACAGLSGGTGIDPQLLVSVNYFGATELIEGLYEQLKPAGSASVVVLSSNSTTCQPGWPAQLAKTMLRGDETAAREAAKGLPSIACYPASKAALAWWCRQEAIKPKWAQNGIRINAIAPGLIATPMTDTVREDPVFGRFADSYPTALKRPGRADEVANLLAFLLDDASSLIVGSVIVIDGGTDAIKNPLRPKGLATGRAGAAATTLAMRGMGRFSGMLNKLPGQRR